MDPCAGKGVAIATLASALSIPAENVYAVELATTRAHDLKTGYPSMNVLAPCSFLGTGISYNSFSLSYVNPPFADEMGGGRREELSFLLRTINLTIPKGIVVMVCPEDVVFDWGPGPNNMRTSLACRLEDVRCFRLPEKHREHNEIVVFGRKRKHAEPNAESPFVTHWWEARDRMGILGDTVSPYQLPLGKRPKRWFQTDFTPEELIREVVASPLKELLEPPRVLEKTRPPLPPGKGHTALRLASGDLDGLVWPESEPPHVVRGISRKVTVRAPEKCEQSEDGGSKEVFKEEMPLVVRAVGVDGVIHTLTDGTVGVAAAPEVDEDEDEDEDE